MIEIITRPQNKTLLNIVKYLESIGLEVVGQNCDLTDGELYRSMKTFDPEEVVRWRELYEASAFWVKDDDHD